MDEFLILLQAKLDEAASKGLINSDISSLQDKLDKLKLQATLDPNAAQKLANDIGKLINQKITISNINIDNNQAVRNAQQTGQQIGDAVNKGVSSSINNIKKNIADTLKGITSLNANDIIKNLNLNRASVGSDIVGQVRLLVSEVNNLGREAAKTNSDSAWEQLIEKCGTLGNLLGSFGKIRNFPCMEEVKRFADYFNGKTISVGYKSSGLSGTDFSTGQLNRALKELGVQFSATKQEAISLDTVWEEMCNTTGRMDLLNITTAQDQLQTIINELQKAQSILNGEQGLIPHPNAHGDVTKYMADVERARDTVINLQNEMSTLMQKESQASTTSADQVVQNENRKQQAIQQTVDVQRQLKENGNIIQQTDFATSFNTKGQAEEYFNVLSKTVSIQEKLGENKNLKSFIVEVKNAEGVVEKLTYKYNELTGAFEYSSGSINNNGVIKQIDAISTKADSLQTKLEKLKSNYSDINSSRPIKDSNNISALSQQYDKVSQAIENVRTADNTTFSSMITNAQREITALESMVTQFRNAENVATQMKSVDISSGIAQAQERLGKLKADSTGFEQMTHTLRELDAIITNVSDKSSLDAFIDKLRVAETQLSRVKAETKSMTQVNKIQLSIETGGYESKVETLIARTRQWTDSEGQARINTAALSDALTKLTQASEAYANNKSEATQKRLIESSKKLDAEYQKITNNVRKMNAEMAKDSAISSLHNQVNEFMSKNGKAVKYSGEFMRIFNETAQGAKLTREEIAKLNQEFNNAVVQARNAGKLGKTFFQTLREGMSLFSYWTSSTFLVMKAIQSVKGGLGTVKALDTALVDLKKTTTMTNNELEDFYYSSNKVAKRMGVTTEEILKQAAAWSRLGYSSAEQATKMAQLSSQFASISPGMSTDEAQEGLVSIIKAWGLDVDEVEREVMDNINHLGNRFAESNIDLVNGMKRSAAALAATGTTYQDAFALFTGAQEVVQNAEVTGRALRSISMRMHGYSENSEDGLMEVDEELKNITGDLIDLTKTAEHSQGVSIFKEGSSTEFKSLVEYFGEINKIWDEMSQVQQNSFLDKAFGKNQAQAGAAIVQNYEAIAEAIKVMEDAAGSSDREMSIIMDSLDYKLNRLSETGTSVAQNLFKRDDMATVVDGLTSVMSVIDKLTSKLGLFGSIGLGAGIFAGVKNIGKNMRVHGFQIICFMF